MQLAPVVVVFALAEVGRIDGADGDVSYVRDGFRKIRYYEL
jgi:hypothetical protein